MMVGSTGSIIVSGDRLPDQLRVHADPTGVLSSSVVRERTCCVGQDSNSSCAPIGDSDVCTGELTTTFAVTVQLLKAGKAPLQVFDAQGALIDFVVVEAKEPATLAVSCAPADGEQTDAPLDTIRLAGGGSCNLSVEALDENGQALRATDDGFTLSIDDAKVSVLRPSFELIDLEAPTMSDVLAASSGTVIARKAGATTLNVTAGSLKRALPIEVK
jgi:hypothetical protein